VKILKIFLAILLWPALIGVSIFVCQRGIDNTLSLMFQNKFFIPKESSFCSFKDTVSIQEGNGTSWLFGEDKRYYYMMNRDNELEQCVLYYTVRKNQGFNPEKLIEAELKKYSRGEIDTSEFLHNTKDTRQQFMDRGEGTKWLPEKFMWDGYIKDCMK